MNGIEQEIKKLAKGDLFELMREMREEAQKWKGKLSDEIIAMIEDENGKPRDSYLLDLLKLSEEEFKEKYTITKTEAFNAYACNFGRS